MNGNYPNRIELTKPSQSRDQNDNCLIVDGKAIDATDVHVSGISSHRFFGRAPDIIPAGDFAVHIRDSRLKEKINDVRLDHIGNSIGVLSLPFRPDWNRSIDRLYLIRQDVNQRDAWNVMFHLTIWPKDWANPYTISDYMMAMSNTVEESELIEEVEPYNLGFIFDDYDPDDEEREGSYWTLGFLSNRRLGTHTLKEEMEFHSERFNALCAATVRTILKKRPDALVTFFEFPPTIKTACEQYLIYFVQFLEDLGIKADSEIKQQAGYLMFSVNPTDGTTALATIKRALEAYLRLPTDGGLNENAEQFRDLAVTQLRANVFFLQSQLELARAVVQAKDASIQALDLVVFQQRQLLSESSKTQLPNSDRENVEPLLGNTVSITEYEGKGFRLNLPLILRQLKRVLRATDEPPGDSS